MVNRGNQGIRLFLHRLFGADTQAHEARALLTPVDAEHALNSCEPHTFALS